MCVCLLMDQGLQSSRFLLTRFPGVGTDLPTLLRQLPREIFHTSSGSETTICRVSTTDFVPEVSGSRLTTPLNFPFLSLPGTTECKKLKKRFFGSTV